MSGVYFVKTAHVYESYRDYWRLVELSGYPAIDYDEIDVGSDNVYIFSPLNAEWAERWPGPVKATMILWDLEFRLKESSYEWPDSDLITPPFISRVWASDKWYAERIKAEYVPFGSHVGLMGTAQAEEAYDCAVMCYIYGRRSTAIHALQERGLSIAPNAWGDERDALLKSSQVVMHIHQHERVWSIAPQRYAIAAAWHKPLISERVYDTGIFETSVLFADTGALADYTALMIRRYPQLLRDKADQLHDTLCVSHSFKSYIEAAL
jgi:hypothetical protein